MEDRPPPFHSDDIGKLLLRLAVGGLMLFHGTFKLSHGVVEIAQQLKGSGLPEFIGYGVYMGEVIAPALIVLGFLTRPAALIEAFTMVVAVLLARRSEVFSLNPMGGGWEIELNAFFFVGAIALFFMGAGKFSVSRGKGWWD